MAWTDVALLVAHAAAILAGALVLRAALARSLRARPAAIAAPGAPAAAPPIARGRDYDEIVSELAALDARLASGELDPTEHDARRTALLAEAKRARRRS